MIGKKRGKFLYEKGREAVVAMQYFKTLIYAEAYNQGWTVDSVAFEMFYARMIGLLALIQENTSDEDIAPLTKEETEQSVSSLGGDQEELPF